MSKSQAEIDNIPEFHEKRIMDDGNVMYHVTCAYCGKEVSYRHSYKPEHCPHCGAKGFRKPKTETQLFNLQRKYLETGSSEVLSRMYLILCNYAKSIIKKHLPRDFTYHYDHVEEKASDAANLLVEQYLSKPGFKVENSFAGYLQWKVKEVLWNKKIRREEDHESLNVQMENEGGDSELLDISDQIDTHSVFSSEEDFSQGSEVENAVLSSELNRRELESGLFRLLDRIGREIEYQYSPLTKLLVLGALSIRLERGLDRNSEDLLNTYYRRFGTGVKPLVDKTMLFIYRFLKEWG